MEETFNKIIQQISNNLDKININNFLNSIKDIKEIKECLDISNQFCETITDSKNKIFLYLSEEKEKFINDNTQINSYTKNTNNDLNKLMNNIKTIISQSKIKLKNLSSNINVLNSNLNLISGNLEKKKYSLATSRIEKLFQLNNTMSTNVKSLETLQLNILKEIKSEQIIIKKPLNSTFTKIRPNRTPSPFTPNRTNTRNKFSTINEKNNINDKKIKTKRDLSLSMFNSKTRGKSTNVREIKNLNTINVDGRSLSRNRINNYEKENEELKKKLSIQKQINDRLTKELNKSRRKSIGNLSSPKINTKVIKDKTEKEIKDASTYMKKNILKFNDKISKISDLIFSLTFSINNIQNKKEILSLLESDLINIKKNLLNITTEISEIKSCLMEISFNKEKNINSNINNKTPSYIDSDDDNNSSNNKIDNLKKENINLQNSIDLYQSQIVDLNQKLTNEQKSKENLEKTLSDIKIKNDELVEKICKIEQLNKSNSNNNLTNKEEADTYLKDISTMSYSEVQTLKEELRNSEKKYLELKGMFDSNIESKNLIENLLKKNNEEIKRTYEQKITKLKKKLEEKDKEINKLKEHFDNEEMNMLNKIKDDNNKNIEKIKSYYENKFISISEQQNNSILNNFSKIEDNTMGKIGRINDELSRINNNDNIENSLNNFSLNLLKEDEKNEFKKQINDLQNKINSLEDENNKLKIKIKKMTDEINENVETIRQNKAQYMNQIFSLQEEILKYKTNENKIKEEILNMEHENRKNKSTIKIYNEEIEEMRSLNNKLLKELEDLRKDKRENKIISSKEEEEEINKLKTENNNYIMEINKLKNNMRETNIRKNELEIELNKIKEEYNKIKMNTDIEHAQIDKLNNNITLLNIEKEKLESKNNELSNKLSKKDKEIILLITNNNKDKKSINEQYKNQIESLKKEVEERRKMNEQFKNQITNLQKKIFQMQNSDNDNDYDKD